MAYKIQQGYGDIALSRRAFARLRKLRKKDRPYTCKSDWDELLNSELAEVTMLYTMATTGGEKGYRPAEMVRIKDRGREYLRWVRRSDARYVVPLIISAIATAISIIALAAQLGLLRLPLLR